MTNKDGSDIINKKSRLTFVLAVDVQKGLPTRRKVPVNLLIYLDLFFIIFILICSYEVVPSAAMSSIKSVIASPFEAKQVASNGTPAAETVYKPVVWSTK